MAEREVRWQGAARTHLDYVVRRISDRDHIRSLLRPRMEYSAYALGQLEPGLFERTSWYWSRGDTGSGLVLHSRGGLGEATFVMGDVSAIAAHLAKRFTSERRPPESATAHERAQWRFSGPRFFIVIDDLHLFNAPGSSMSSRLMPALS